jgi:nucleoside-diphosphate-sugar epimerase
MLGTYRRGELSMRVLVTGGTGYVGCHTAAALAGQGHQVRLLVRARDRIAAALDPLGVAGADAVVGDVTSAASVEQAVLGCDAVVHAASVFSLDPRRAAVMQQANPAAAETVLGAARRHGLDPIVYVSTMGVFVPATTPMLTSGTPLGAGIGPYTRSKIAAEQVARGAQQAGAPVVITYPAVVQGPHDPHLGDSVRFVRDLLRGRLPVLPRGRLSFVDVRDVAALHAAVLRPGQGARRYLLGGPAVEVTQVAAVLGELTGRRLPHRTAPDWALQRGGRLADRAQRLLPVRLPVSAEQVALPLSIPVGVIVDDSATRQELAIERRELRQTLADTVRWLAARRLVTARQAGALAR